MIRITFYPADQSEIRSVSHPSEALLCLDRVYQPGDRFEISGPRHLMAQLDQSLQPGELYLPDGKMTWTVPGMTAGQR